MDASPDSSRPPERPLTPLVAALWTLALVLLTNLIAGVTQSARPGAESDVVNLAACEVLGTSLIVFFAVRWHARDASLRQMLAFRPIAPLHALLSIAAGAGLFPLFSTVEALLERRWPAHDPELAESLQKIVSSSSRPALVVAVLVVMPLAREIFFRGLLFTGLKRRAGLQSALVVTAACYACAQLQWQEMPTLFVLGLATAWLCERTGTVVSAILAQLAYGAVEGIPILRGADPAAEVTYSTRWIVGGAVIALLALVAVGAGKREEES
jgi:membrane protease YdiL (CAAX protease family)